MDNTIKFEELYAFVKNADINKAGYDRELVFNKIFESKNILFLILKKHNIDYDDFFRNELIDIYERRYNGNPNKLPFSEKFQKDVYSDYCEKLSYLDFLFEAHSLKKDVDFHLLKIAERTLNGDNILHFYTLFDTFNMLYLKEVQKENIPLLFEVINLLIDKTNENHFSTDIFVRIDCLIQDYYEPRYFSIIEKGRKHENGKIEDYFRIPSRPK